MATEVEYSSEARRNLLDGIQTLEDAVKITLGPRGRYAVLEEQFGVPEMTIDGVNVADEIEIEAPIRGLGAELLQEVADETQEQTGDGTTTATLLAARMFEEGMQAVEAGANPQALRRGIEEAAQRAIEKLREYAHVIGPDEIEEVATISANNQQQVGEGIAEALEVAGEDGVIMVEEGRGIETELDLVEGMRFEEGYKSPHLVTDEERQIAELDDPYILIYDGEISALDEIIDLLEAVARDDENLLIIADDIDGEALTALVVNKVRGQLDACAVEAPGFGDTQTQKLEDIAVLTGGEVVSEEKGMQLSRVSLSQLGRAGRVTVTEEETTIVEGQGSESEIQDRVAQIEGQIQQADSSYDRDKLEERRANLAGGVARILVGAATEPEMEEKTQRYEDALDATRAALAEGIVPGGGVALIRVQQDLQEKQLEAEKHEGLRILREALSEPARQIADNAGEEGNVIVEKIRQSDRDQFGFNARTREFEDLVEAGVIDPLKVTRIALENAASIAGMLLTTEAAVVEEQEEDEEADAAEAGGEAAPGGAPGGGMPAGGMGGMP